MENGPPTASPGAASDLILQVALAGPLAGLFDYRPPGADGEAAVRLAPGQRVLVPFGRGRRVGLLVELAEGSDQPPERLRAALAVLDCEPLLSALDLELVRWAADYYRHPVGDALLGALPTRLRRPAVPLDGTCAGVRATHSGQTLESSELRRARVQRQILDLLQGSPSGIALGALRERIGASAGPLRELIAKGLVMPCRVPDPTLAVVQHGEIDSGPSLNADQALAVSEVTASLGTFQPFLLEGVTGSGKTEVYIRLIETVIERGGQALVLVPEIGLTPQLEERLRRRLPGPQSLLHSALDEAARERAWMRAARGEATLVVGTRSACFVPLPRLALVLVDEEHDASLKQQCS